MIKRLSGLLVFAFLLSGTIQVSAQPLVESFKNADFRGIYNLLAERVDILTDRENASYSRDEAIEILKYRYRSFLPEKWEVVHSGDSGGTDGKYYILKMYNKEGKGTRIFIHLEHSPRGDRISVIKFRRLL